MKTIGFEDIPDFISRYGKRATKALLRFSVIQLRIPTNDELLAYGFNKKCLNVVKSHIKNGKLVQYINKSNGKVKKQYYGSTMNKYINNLSIEQYETNIIILKKMYNRLYNNYKLKFKDVDLEIDPITCDKIHDPCYIIPDWNSGNKIIYNWETLINCKETRRVYIGFDIDETGQKLLYYKDVFTGSYVSPYTKRKFIVTDVKFLSRHLLDKFK